MKNFLISALTAILTTGMIQAERYAGGDISLLPEYEAAGAKFKTHEGEPISYLLPWCREQGMNAMRVRLFVDPSKYTGSDKDPNACQTLDYIIPLCQKIKQNGFSLMLDFHYSDTWADPAKQFTPADWAGLTDEELYQKIYDYTKESLQILQDAGVTPDFIQPGNEISYGMLWGPEGTPANEQKKVYYGSSANWDRLGNLLKQAIAACNEICPDAKIVLHTERVAQQNVLKNFYNRMKTMNVQYDIIGLSYYPYWHGDLTVLNGALDMLETSFKDKKIMIVETGYPYKWEVPGSDHDNTDKWPYSDAGQNKFAQDLVKDLEKYSSVTGLFWWWMEYNAFNTNLSGWYNAPLFDSTTGRATSAFRTICSFADDSGIDQITYNATNKNTLYFNLSGIPANEDNHGVLIRVMDGKSEKIIFK